MKIYTSYFGNSRKLAQADVKMISIALWKPKFFNGSCYYPAAPLRSMLSNNVSREEYIAKYQECILAQLKPEKVIQDIEYMSEGKDVALCCYEKPSDFCHRHLFAKWLTEKTGIEVKEFEVEEEKPRMVEQSLFGL